MMHMGALGRAAYGHMQRSRSGARRLGGEIVSGIEVAAGGFGAGLLTGLSQKNGQKGNVPYLPIPVPIPLAIGALGVVAAWAAGKTGSVAAEHHILDITKGALGAQAALAGVKVAYRGSGQAPQLSGVMPYGYPGMIGPGVGASPETLAFMREAGVPV